MRLLLVEDNADFAGTVETAVRAILDCELVWARSRDTALERLAQEYFDLVVLDRRIPTADGVLDDHINHGWRVFKYVAESFPGTPVWFLTGTEDHDFAADLNNDHGRTGCIHGHDQAEPIYLVCWKKKISDCIRRIKKFAQHRAELGRIALSGDVESLQLNQAESNVLRLFARRYHGTSIDLTSLNGGLSRSRVLKVVVLDASNRALITAAAKVSTLSDIRDEELRYRNEISRLIPGGFPQLTMTIDVGAGNFGGLFYGMIGASVESLFSRIAARRVETHAVPNRLREIEAPWYQSKRVEEVNIGQIRRKLIGDTLLPKVQLELVDIDIKPVELVRVRAGQCSQHGDLHCANVVFASGPAMLIDFGDAGTSYCVLDPVTLELSTVFHSQHASLPCGWPTEADMAAWFDVDRYTKNCAFAPFIKACRAWAVQDAASIKEIAAVA